MDDKRVRTMVLDWSEIVTKLSSGDARRMQRLSLTFSGFRIARLVAALDQA